MRALPRTLRGRFIGERDTVAINPVGTVDSALAFDLKLELRTLLARGLGLSFRVTNRFDEEYFDPGIRAGNAGTTPGGWDENGVWQGSRGWYSSLLPQPGRQFAVVLRVDC